MKLSEKVARQELEPARLARIGRRRIAPDRMDVLRRMLELPADKSRKGPKTAARAPRS
jgi:hypothetical protein